MNISQILGKFKENKSSKVGEFGYIYPELLHSLVNKNNVVILEIGQRRGETFQRGFTTTFLLGHHINH